jgi:hypothetical protein|tara:strand:+ start:1565 stop:1930 length:366 start_codon:yes stop_codon:yes gene_type:complete
MNSHTMKDLKNNDAKPIMVLNVLTEEYQVFMNGYDLETNLVSAIIFATGDSKKILDDDYRNKIKKEARIEYMVTKLGAKKVYSPEFDMISYYQVQHEFFKDESIKKLQQLSSTATHDYLNS